MIADMFLKNRDSLLDTARLIQKSKLKATEKTSTIEANVSLSGTNSILPFSSAAGDIATLTISPSVVKDEKPTSKLTSQSFKNGNLSTCVP